MSILFLLNKFRKYDAPQLFGKAITKVDTHKKLIALTFDDGPNPPYTQQIIDLLDEHNAKASFFVLGRNAVKYPKELESIYQSGHEIGNHSWDHKRLIFKSPSYIKSQIASTDSIIRVSGYTREIYFRAPFGNKLFVLPWVLKQMNKKHILFNIVVYDWKDFTIKELLESIDQQIENGSIIDLHENATTVELTQSILEKYSKEGYQFVTVSELLLSEE